MMQVMVSTASTSTIQTETKRRLLNQQDRIHASINLAFKESDINVSLYGKNLTDKVLYE